MKLTWRTLEVSGPGPRSRHCLWYDSELRATVLFGGLVWLSSGGVSFPNGIWMLCDGGWHQMECPVSPSPRHRSAAAFDKSEVRAVLFGGQSPSNQFLSDTWLHKNGIWRRQRFWFGPSRRCGHVMAFDEATGQVVLFGGINHVDQPLGDTWVFDGSWHYNRSTGPSTRRYAAFAYDPELKGCVLHGGAKDDAGKVLYGDSWLFSEGHWKQLPGSLSTSPRDDHALVYHDSAKRLIMAGGLRADCLLVRSRDSWEPSDASLPRFQCAPMTYDDQLGGVLLYGGETGHGGNQFESTRLLVWSR